MRKTASKVLKEEYQSIKDSLPPLWIDLYIVKFLSNVKGLKMAEEERTLQNIRKGVTTPTPQHLSNMKLIINNN